MPNKVVTINHATSPRVNVDNVIGSIVMYVFLLEH